jgi:hypothetical protein
MNKNLSQAQVNTIGALAKAYNVGYKVFCSWIEVNPELKELLQPYRDNKKRVFPPLVITGVYIILGEPGK